MFTRLFIDPPADGAWNMAVDELLLAGAAGEGKCPSTDRADVAALRFYQWDQPTLSLGYFQPLAQRDEHPASRGCPVVRRRTGGGAILHDRELTYSIALPEGHPAARSPHELYAAAHGALQASLADIAGPRLERPKAPGSEAPFLCFQRRSAADLVYEGAKIAGSAQRRRRGGVLQHGSVILARSPRAPEIAGLYEATGRAVTAEQLIAAWRPRLAERLGLDLKKSSLGDEERAEARMLQEFFQSAAWLGRR